MLEEFAKPDGFNKFEKLPDTCLKRRARRRAASGPQTQAADLPLFPVRGRSPPASDQNGQYDNSILIRAPRLN